MTTKVLYNLDGMTFKRRIPIEKIRALTKSMQEGNFNFLVHIKGEYDYRFKYKERDEMVD